MTQDHDVIAYRYVIENMISALTDMNEILTITELETLEKTIKHMTNILPNIKHIPANSNLEMMQKKIKNMTNNLPSSDKSTMAKNEENLQKAIEKMTATTTNMINVLGITNKEVLQRALETVPTVIPTIIQMFSQVDWDQFEPSDEDIQMAQRILKSKGIEQFIKEGFIEENVQKELSNPFKTVLLILMLLYSMICFINDLTIMTVQEIKYNQITPVIDSMTTDEPRERRLVEEHITQQLNDLLKEKIPHEIIHLFKIVGKNNLSVYQENTTDSKRLATLDVLDIVQVFERKKEWARVLCEHGKKEHIIEGWVLTKDLKEIK